MRQITLEQGECLLWQGRPAPRCYTFRYWKQALAGAVLFLLSSFWLMLAIELAKEGEPRWLALIPLPLIAGSFIFGPLQILLCRWRWPRVFYHLTDRRLVCSLGGSLPLADISVLKKKAYSETLASLRLETAAGQGLTLVCVEQPAVVLSLLQEHCPQIRV